MPDLEQSLERWTHAAVIDAPTADRIRAYEAKFAETGRLRWPIVLALALGVIMLGAGVLLFIAAHWDQLSPWQRFGLTLLLIAGFHVPAAMLREKFSKLSVALHALGTVALGAGIALAGQIFNLQEHWPAGIMLWAAGAWLAWWLLRDWTQAALAALLTPAWLFSEWMEGVRVATGGQWSREQDTHIAFMGLLLLALVYLGARSGERASYTQRALAYIGGLAIMPLVFGVLLTHETHYYYQQYKPMPFGLELAGYLTALLAPLALAWYLRGREAWHSLAWAVWVLVLGTFVIHGYRWWGGANQENSLGGFIYHELGPYFWAGIGSLGLIYWGLRELRRERINLGMAGFSITVLCFYFAQMMDKLGRSASLIGFGLIFLLGGWAMEKMRRRLVARVQGGAA